MPAYGQHTDVWYVLTFWRTDEPSHLRRDRRVRQCRLAGAERRMLDRIRAMHDRTVIIITHRSEVLDYCDSVITLGASGAQ